MGGAYFFENVLRTGISIILTNNDTTLHMFFFLIKDFYFTNLRLGSVFDFDKRLLFYKYLYRQSFLFLQNVNIKYRKA